MNQGKWISPNRNFLRMYILPAVSSAMQRAVRPSVRLTWKMKRSWEYDTWLSLSPANFSSICLAMALAFVAVAENSARTTDPLASSAYSIAILFSKPPQLLVSESKEWASSDREPIHWSIWSGQQWFVSRVMGCQMETDGSVHEYESKERIAPFVGRRIAEAVWKLERLKMEGMDTPHESTTCSRHAPLR